MDTIRQGNKRHPNHKEKSKIILYMENPKECIKNNCWNSNYFNEVTGYKINLQKSIAFLYIKSEPSEKILEKQSHLR